MSQDSTNRQVRNNPGRPAGGNSDKVRLEDFVDAAQELVKDRPDVVFHLAAIPSGGSYALPHSGHRSLGPRG